MERPIFKRLYCGTVLCATFKGHFVHLEVHLSSIAVHNMYEMKLKQYCVCKFYYNIDYS